MDNDYKAGQKVYIRGDMKAGQLIGNITFSEYLHKKDCIVTIKKAFKKTFKVIERNAAKYAPYYSYEMIKYSIPYEGVKKI